MAEGLINIYKEQNMTSHDVVGRLRRIFHMKRVGHTGTLDPMATGVLPVALGNATKIMEYLDADIKSYRCTMVLGREYDTEDVWGSVTKEAPLTQVNKITSQDVEKALTSQTGVIQQLPPMYSAIRSNGKRLYEYARNGETVERKRRETWVGNLVIEEMKLNAGYESEVTFTMDCTKGTYVRSICQAAGEILGVHAAMSCLERTASGIFQVESAITLAELENMEESQREALLVPQDKPLSHLGRLKLEGPKVLRFLNGQRMGLREYSLEEQPTFEKEDFVLSLPDTYGKTYRVYGKISEGEEIFLGIGILKDKDVIHPSKIFADLRDVMTKSK